MPNKPKKLTSANERTDTMHHIQVSVVYVTSEHQWFFEQRVARGTSAQELIELSGFHEKIADLKAIDIDALDIGVFSQKTSLDTLLEEGDRVEIYRPLTADPKEVRRQLALIGKTMGNK
jgi:putative ubiquitin-RnfH superfamily antitoxin RatB of RatAB toxin-antitoxin module